MKLFNKVAAIAVGVVLATGVGAGIVLGSRNTKVAPAYALNNNYTLITAVGSLSNGDKVVVAQGTSTTPSVGVTGWNGTKDATVSSTESDWVQYEVKNKSANGWQLYDSGADNYIKSPGSSNQFLYGTAGTCSVNSNGVLTCNSRYLVQNGSFYRMYTSIGTYTPFYVYKVTAQSADPTTYTGVTISEGTALTGEYKGDAYYICSATVTGTGNFSSNVTWSITSSNTYGSGTSIANKASIDTNGKITFLDNCTVYVWATAADGETHNNSGFSVVASGLLDNPISSWTKITNTDNVSVTKVYALSNDGTLFASNSVSSNNIALTSSLGSIGYVALESTDGGYYVRFATKSAGVWSANGHYIKWANDSTKLSSTASPDSTYGKWNVVANSTNGIYLKNTSSNRHLGLNGSTDIRAYAASNIGSNVPVYLYEAGSLPTIECAVIELTGKPTESMSIGDTATLGYTAYDEDLNDWTGDVTYSISNESTSGVVELSAHSGASVTLTAKKAGTARVSVQDDAGNATPDYVDVTVLADPERIDLPVGDYSVTISISGSGATIPETTSHEIKPKVGRTWYKNLVLNYTDITNAHANEYTMTKTTGIISTTNNSNAIITSVEIDYYQYENATMYAGSTPVSSTAGTNSENANSLMKIYAVNAQNFSLKNESGYAQSFYSLKINLEVIDENEEFLNLVVSKSASWSTANNGTYKEGQSPTNSGLVATANFTTDGSTISRSEDVTELVSNWAFTPSTLSTSDTSFNVVATWSGHNSASFEVTNISVEAITGDIPSGRYFIISQSGNTLDRVAVTAKACPQEDILSSASWTFTLVDNDTYNIHATIGGSEKYLTILNDSQGLRTNGTTSDLWTVTAVSGGYTLLHNSSERYLVDYLAAGEQWRTYKSANAEGYNTITLTEEKEAFANNFLSSFTAGCNSNGGYTAADMDWTAAATQFATLSTENQNVFKTTEYTKSGSGSNTVVTPNTPVANAVARYDYIVTKYNTTQTEVFTEFMGRVAAGKITYSSSNRLSIASEGATAAAMVIVVVSVISVTAIGGFFLLKKKPF